MPYKQLDDYEGVELSLIDVLFLTYELDERCL